MSPVSLVHLYYYITGVLRPSYIFSLPYRDEYLEYPTLISLTNLSIFPHKSYDVEMPIIFGLENLAKNTEIFLYVHCLRETHINRDLLNNIVIPQLLTLKQRGTDLRNDATNFWRLALPRDCLTLAHFQILGIFSIVLMFLSLLSADIILDLRRDSFF